MPITLFHWYFKMLTVTMSILYLSFLKSYLAITDDTTTYRLAMRKNYPLIRINGIGARLV